MLDKRLLVDSVTVRKVLSVDKWGKQLYSEPILLKNVRFDRGIRIERGAISTKGGSKQAQNGCLYIYPQFEDVTVDDEWLHALVNDGIHDYEIVSITINKMPYNSKVFSYELDVI